MLYASLGLSKLSKIIDERFVSPERHNPRVHRHSASRGSFLVPMLIDVVEVVHQDQAPVNISCGVKLILSHQLFESRVLTARAVQGELLDNL